MLNVTPHRDWRVPIASGLLAMTGLPAAAAPSCWLCASSAVAGAVVAQSAAAASLEIGGLRADACAGATITGLCAAVLGALADAIAVASVGAISVAIAVTLAQLGACAAGLIIGKG